jgi:hypothetical protein
MNHRLHHDTISAVEIVWHEWMITFFDLKRTEEEAVVAFLKVLSWHLPEGLSIVSVQVEICSFYFLANIT